MHFAGQSHQPRARSWHLFESLSGQANRRQVMAAVGFALIVASVLFWQLTRQVEPPGRTLRAAKASTERYVPSWGFPPPVIGAGRRYPDAAWSPSDSMPVGSQFDIRVRGCVRGQLTDEARPTGEKGFLTYGFEMEYRSVILRNDGHEVVEHRRFGPTRMAKLITEVDPGPVRLTASTESFLEGLPFAGPMGGIQPASAVDVASTLLRTDSSLPAAGGLARGFVEEHPLSGQSLRLTFHRSMGLVAIEDATARLDDDTRSILFAQRLPCGQPNWRVPRSEAVRDGGPIRIAFPSWSDPSIVLVHWKPTVAVTECELPSGMVRWRVSMARLSGRFARGWEVDERSGPCGHFDYDPATGLVHSGSMCWQVASSAFSEKHLLFEDEFEQDPELVVYFECHRVK